MSTPAEAHALDYCARRNVKIAQSADGHWIILDQEHTPFYWALFLSEGFAALAYQEYRDNLDDYYNRGLDDAYGA